MSDDYGQIDNAPAPGSDDPLSTSMHESFEEMHRVILVNAPIFIVFEDLGGRFQAIFPRTTLTSNCHDHPNRGDAINEAYLLLRRVLMMECAILELDKATERMYR